MFMTGYSAANLKGPTVRVLQIAPAYFPELQFGGPVQAIHALSNGLAKRGHDVRVIAFRSDEPFAHRCVDIEGIPVHYLPWVGYGTWQIPFNLTRLREWTEWADVVHCYGLYNLLCPTAAFFARRSGRPYVLEPLGMYVPRLRHQQRKRLYHRLFSHRMAQGAARVVATSVTEKIELDTLVSPARLTVRANPFDFAGYQKLPDSQALRARFQLTATDTVVVFIGRISPIKNLEKLIQAFAQVDVPNARLLLVGPQLEPDYAARLRHQIAALRLEARVTLTGPLFGEEKLAALAAADLFVLPSVSESFGNAAAEAVAAGLPVLLTDTCGIAPVIHGRAGLAVAPTVDGLATGLRVMLTDEAQRAQMMTQHAAVIAELAGEEPVDQMEQLYQQIMLEH
jgi:glycosyltransferase involved in cell wall biosynthesis